MPDLSVNSFADQQLSQVSLATSSTAVSSFTTFNKGIYKRYQDMLDNIIGGALNLGATAQFNADVAPSSAGWAIIGVPLMGGEVWDQPRWVGNADGTGTYVGAVTDDLQFSYGATVPAEATIAICDMIYYVDGTVVNPPTLTVVFAHGTPEQVLMEKIYDAEYLQFPYDGRVVSVRQAKFVLLNPATGPRTTFFRAVIPTVQTQLIHAQTTFYANVVDYSYPIAANGLDWTGSLWVPAEEPRFVQMHFATCNGVDISNFNAHKVFEYPNTGVNLPQFFGDKKVKPPGFLFQFDMSPGFYWSGCAIELSSVELEKEPPFVPAVYENVDLIDFPIHADCSEVIVGPLIGGGAAGGRGNNTINNGSGGGGGAGGARIDQVRIPRAAIGDTITLRRGLGGKAAAQNGGASLFTTTGPLGTITLSTGTAGAGGNGAGSATSQYGVPGVITISPVASSWPSTFGALTPTSRTAGAGGSSPYTGNPGAGSFSSNANPAGGGGGAGARNSNTAGAAGGLAGTAATPGGIIQGGLGGTSASIEGKPPATNRDTANGNAGGGGGFGAPAGGGPSGKGGNGGLYGGGGGGGGSCGTGRSDYGAHGEGGDGYCRIELV